jgi:hypothetical protein
MDDHLWMYQDSLKGLRRMDCYNRVRGFINYVLFNSRNINESNMRCPCTRCKNKKFLDSDIVTMHLLQKGFVKRYVCWFAHKEPYVPHETIIERIIGSTYSSSNVHEIIYNNSNPYRTLVIDTMKMNQGYASQCSIINEEHNANTTRFFLSFERL